MRCLSGTLLAALAALLAGRIASPQQVTTSAPTDLGSPVLEVRKAAAEHLVADALERRAAVISRFASVINANSQSHDLGPAPAKALALEALGALRAQDAIAVLVREIDYVVLVPDNHYPWSGRPAVRALIQIGLPAVVDLLQSRTLEQASSRTLGNIAVVIRYTFPNAQTARAFVEAYDPGYSEGARKNRAIVLEYIVELPELRAAP